jgi:CBS-domain-containing membrane protein
VAVHLIGSQGGGLVAIGETVRFVATLRVHGAAAPDGTLASARVSCPRKGCVDGGDCVDCVHLQAFRAAPAVRLYCSVDDREPVADWMRRKPPSTTVDTRCHAADEFAAARGVHHLLVFDCALALVGVACRCDLGRGGTRAVADVMSSDVFAAPPATTLGDAAAAMKQLHVSCLPVVAGPLVLGIITRRDLDRIGVPA